MTTDRRTAANRANAAHSTGPRTAEGKVASSRNAMSHGITSTGRVTIFNWESPEEYQQLREDYCARFCPIDRVEFKIIERMVDATWRRKRAITIETTIYDLEISEIEEEVREDFAAPSASPSPSRTATATESGTPSSASSTPRTAAAPALSAISKSSRRTALTRTRSSPQRRRTRIPRKNLPPPRRPLRSPKSWK